MLEMLTKYVTSQQTDQPTDQSMNGNQDVVDS